MAVPFSLLFIFLLFVPVSGTVLTPDYYKQSCPEFDRIMREIVTTKQISNPTTAAATLRLFFHDCMVEGCDASVLIASNAFNKAERDADINLSLAGDGFDVIVRAKTALELSCPGVVSCSDILTQATRDLITMVGGPFYKVSLGRKDGLVSQASRVEGNLPKPNMNTTRIIDMFGSKNVTFQELVALVGGGHTIGFSHCSEFANRLYSYNKTTPTDPSYHPRYAERLKVLCGNYVKEPGMSAFNDAMTPGKFDNMYYRNLLRGLGLLSSDAALVNDPRTVGLVKLYAANQTLFFQDFARAIEKFSLLGVKTGGDGEVRHRCDTFNFIKT